MLGARLDDVFGEVLRSRVGDAVPPSYQLGHHAEGGIDVSGPDGCEERDAGHPTTLVRESRRGRYRAGMTTTARRHLCVAVTGPVAERLEVLRRGWDPVMAALVPVHVTITYPEETGDDELLVRRAARCVVRTRPFRLRVGASFAEDDGHGGVFFAVEDVEQGWARLRRGLLAPPFRALDFPPHVTVVHPRTSPNGPACLAALADHDLPGEFQVTELLFTETTASAFRVLRRFELVRT